MKKVNIKKVKKTNKSPKKTFWKPRVLVPLVLFLVVFGGFGAYKVATSSAWTAAATGTMDFRFTRGPYDTGAVYSSTGNVCWATNFNAYNIKAIPGSGYYGYLQVLYGTTWVTVADGQSQKFQYNGNRDHQCYKEPGAAGNYFRVRFQLTSSAYAHGTYWVWGYTHN